MHFKQRYHTQETGTTAEVVHLPLKMPETCKAEVNKLIN
jgi:hypothetical protein